jgi:hypothetical protein
MFVHPKAVSFNKTDNVRLTKQYGAFAKQLLPWKSNKYYIFVYACALAWMSTCVWMNERGRVALLNQYATRLRHIFCGISDSTTFFS